MCSGCFPAGAEPRARAWGTQGSLPTLPACPSCSALPLHPGLPCPELDAWEQPQPSPAIPSTAPNLPGAGLFSAFSLLAELSFGLCCLLHSLAPLGCLQQVWVRSVVISDEKFSLLQGWGAELSAVPWCLAPPQALHSQADLVSRSPVTPEPQTCSCGGQNSRWMYWEQMSIIVSVLIQQSSQSALKGWIS